MEQDTANSGGAFVPEPLEDIFSREPETEAPQAGGQPESDTLPEPAAETGEAVEAPPEAERERDPETGRFMAKQPEPAPQTETGPPPVKDEPPQTVPLSAVLEERKKRQALEAQLRAIMAQQQPQAPQQPAQPQVPLEDLVFQDPKRFVEVMAQRQEEALLQTRIATSEAVARQQPDYDAAEQALTAYAQSSPRAAAEVAAALRAHPAPAMWAYQAGKQLLAQSPEAIEARIAAEVERRIAARAPASSSAPPPRLPGTVADVRSAGQRTTAASQIGSPLEDIVRFKR
jgi:hypothetical protein